MRKIILSVMVVFVFVALPAYAQKGASDMGKEKASPQAIFNRTADWFATIGKSDAEKEKIIAERKAKRAAKRAEKEARKAKKEAEKKAGEAKDKMKNMEKDAGKEAAKAKNKAKNMEKKGFKGSMK